MAYKHILIAVDLSPESKVLVDKAVSMARPDNAKVSLIHVDVNYLRPLHRSDRRESRRYAETHLRRDSPRAERAF